MIIIDYKDRRSIYEQIIDRYKELILKGILKPDTQLPSVRNLAIELSINPNTIQRAYSELEKKGYIYSVKGKGSFIADNNRLMQEKKEEVLELLNKLVREAKCLGISEDELTGRIRDEYKEDNERD